MAAGQTHVGFSIPDFAETRYSRAICAFHRSRPLIRTMAKLCDSPYYSTADHQSLGIPSERLESHLDYVISFDSIHCHQRQSISSLVPLISVGLGLLNQYMVSRLQTRDPDPECPTCFDCPNRGDVRMHTGANSRAKSTRTNSLDVRRLLHRVSKISGVNY